MDPPDSKIVPKNKNTWTYRALTPENVARVEEMLNQDRSYRSITLEVGISPYYVRQIFDGIEVPTNGLHRPTRLPKPKIKPNTDPIIIN